MTVEGTEGSDNDNGGVPEGVVIVWCRGVAGIRRIERQGGRVRMVEMLGLALAWGCSSTRSGRHLCVVGVRRWDSYMSRSLIHRTKAASSTSTMHDDAYSLQTTPSLSPMNGSVSHEHLFLIVVSFSRGHEPRRQPHQHKLLLFPACLPLIALYALPRSAFYPPFSRLAQFSRSRLTIACSAPLCVCRSTKMRVEYSFFRGSAVDSMTPLYRHRPASSCPVLICPPHVPDPLPLHIAHTPFRLRLLLVLAL